MELDIKYLSFIIVLVFCLASCISNDPEDSRQEVQFFDLIGFFSQESSELIPGKYAKTVSVSGNSETSDVEVSNITSDLSGFQLFDINKRAWKDKYEVDSTFNQDGTLDNIIYTTEDEKLKTKHLKIEYKNGKPQIIEASNIVNNILYTSEQNLKYQSGKGFFLETTQDVVLFSKKDARIQVSFPGQ
ncbi:MAG: hypothetical protein AAF502_15170 [Bacteroidota bacterium]